MKKQLENDYPSVHFLGHKTGHELHKLIAYSGFVVVPSVCYENCSMVVLEAMACGKPIVGTRIGGIPEQIEDGKTGLLFEMGNVRDLAEKMEQLIGSPDLQHQMGHEARKKLEQEYSLEAHHQQLLKIYSDVLEA
ncbi:glycosyltransferase family 4 protein [Desulfobulbus sp. US2]|nr:glycosyltransferase family 4 protein [Desulfobulbus sp. US2]